MRPFFPFFGGKWKLAEDYGAPRYDHVIEAFGGGAGYSCVWEPKKVTLIERDPVVFGVWKFLQGTSPREIKRLPSNISSLDELPSWVCREARWLIGFWFDQNPAKPAQRRHKWARTPRRGAFYWSETIKSRIASQLDRIQHWNIIEASYNQAPNREAHWFIDPPYHGAAGRNYRYHDIDYPELAKWCRSRLGFVQVCEQEGATWLPFKPLSILNTHRPRGYSMEVLCEIDNRKRTRGRRSRSSFETDRQKPTRRSPRRRRQQRS